MTRPLLHRLQARIESRLGDNFHLIRGSLSVMLSTGLTSLAGWLFWVVATSRWSPGEIGVSTSLVAAFSTIALVAGQPIVTTMLLRLPRANNRRGLLRAGLLLGSAIAFVGSIIVIFVLPSSDHTVRSVGVAALFVLSAGAVAIGLVLDASSLAIRRPHFMVVRNGAHGVGKLVLLLVITSSATLISAPVAILTSWACLSVTTCLWEWRKWTHAANDDLPNVPSAAPTRSPVARRAEWHELRHGFGLQVVGTLGGSLPPQVLPIVVIGVLGATQAGWFSITWLVGGLCFVISPAVCQAFLAESSLNPDQLAAKTMAAAVFSSGLLVTPLLVYLFAGHFVLGLFGRTYAQHGTALLAILAVSSIPDLVTNVAVARFWVQGRRRAAALVNGLIALVAVVGAVWALPRFGIDGAGWAWTVGQVAGCVMLLGIVGSRQLAPLFQKSRGAHVAPRDAGA